MGFPARRRDRPSESQASPRAEWYDRNAAPQPKTYAANNVAPHVATQRWSYTVPSGKKAWLESLFLFVIRQTAATAAGRSGCAITVTQDALMVNLLNNEFTDNTVNHLKDMFATNFGILVAGNVVTGWTFDESTGGTMGYTIAAKLTQFDG